MKQKLILLALVIGLTIVSQSSLSLGMGKIQVYSSLNEPLRSSIDLITSADEELENLQVKLASSEDYQKVGLDKSFVPSNIMVNLDAENPYQINVTSNGPVTEPIVSLLLDVEWGNGRILREFTILLDPPVYETSNVDVQVNSVVVEPIAEEAFIEPVVESEAAESETTETAPQETVTYTNEDVAQYEEQTDTVEPIETVEEPVYSAMADEVTVEAGDTLWRIANNNKVGNLTTHQMMMAIFNNNPNAFIDNNINQLIKGSRLDLPTLEEASNIGYSEALAQVESHNQSWNPSTPDYSTIQTESTVEDTYQEPETTLDYGVQLSGSDAGDSDNGQSNSDASSDESAMALEEDLLTTDTENKELKERISQLEDIVEQQQEVIEVSDDGLANLENQLANAADETLDTAEDAMTDVMDDANQVVDETVADVESAADDVWDSVTDDSSTNVDSEDGLNLAVEDVSSDTDQSQILADVDAGTDTDSSTDDTAAIEDVAEEVKPPVVVPRKPEPSFIEKIMNWVTGNLMWVLIGLGALIALIFIPRFLGGSDDEEEDGTSFLDDIKNRKRDDAETEDTVDTKMNQPLMSDEPETYEETEGDVLAELDKSIDFEDDEYEASEDEESEDADEDIAEDSTEESSPNDDEFDLDGFLNDEDDFESDMSDTVDHSETMADVSFDEDDSSDQDSEDVEAVQDDELDDFDLDDLNLEDDLEELSADAADSIEEIVEDADEAVEDMIENADDAIDEVEESIDDVVEEAQSAADDDFSFDDESFDFDLDDELEELEEMEDIEEAAQTDEDSTDAEEEFNDMLDLSGDKEEDSFETIEEEDSMDDDEIDLGLEDLMDDGDAIGTKLDLAKAYIDMGDSDSAKNLLDEVFAEGTEEQISEAKKLLDDM